MVGPGNLVEEGEAWAKPETVNVRKRKTKGRKEQEILGSRRDRSWDQGVKVRKQGIQGHSMRHLVWAHPVPLSPRSSTFDNLLVACLCWFLASLATLGRNSDVGGWTPCPE
jgi:hypothetical protein